MARLLGISSRAPEGDRLLVLLDFDTYKNARVLMAAERRRPVE
jgi:hypothetical protein